jgi:acyl transferase domain-containing protein/NADPH:quinone reductase-like Zn-dependent oxidoreductase/NADP-dependent 3-hydroxy acid dehydrogenase YdfG
MNPRDFMDHLANKRDMTTPTQRYPEGYRDLPPRTGTIPDIASFDKDFFKFNTKQVEKMDIGIRLMLEVTHEALMDAHIDIGALRGSNTGVYVGHCFSDYLGQVSRDKTLTGYELVNGAHAMAANKLSFQYDLKGPSMVFDTACSSSLVALDAAVRDMENGTIERAIVGGISITLDPAKNATFNAFTMLSPTGSCYSFDERANGYCRSEGIACLVLERESNTNVAPACKILATSVNSDGFKDKGITFPSGTQQYENAKMAFRRAGVSPDSIGYIEAHGTGTVAGDSQELGGFDRLFYGDTNDSVPREIPIGSVKSNMGHAEGASGLMSVIKCIGMYEHRKLFPNANFVSTAHAQILSNKFKVVEEAVDWEPTNTCISNYGFGGTNAFAVLAPGGGNALRVASPQDPPAFPSSGIEHVFGNTTDVPTSSGIGRWFADQIALGNDAGFKYRNGTRQLRVADKLVVLYGGQGSQWNQMGKSLYGTNDTFTATIDRLSAYLTTVDPTIDLKAMYVDGSVWMEKKNSVLGITSYQIAVTNMMEEIGVYPDHYLGHSLGESVAGYVCYHVDNDGTKHRLQTENQTIHLALVRSNLSSSIRTDSFILKCGVTPPTTINGAGESIYERINVPGDSSATQYHYIKRADFHLHTMRDTDETFDLDGCMAAVGLSVDDIDRHIQSIELRETVVACRNSPTGQTVSGPKTEMRVLRESLITEFPDLFWREVPTDNVAYHAPHLRCHFGHIVNQLSKIFDVSEPHPLPDKWIGTCGSQMFDNTYHANNIVNPVYFQDAIESIPAGATVIEIGSSSSLLGQVKRIRTDIGTMGIVKVGNPETEEPLRSNDALRTHLWLNGTRAMCETRDDTKPTPARLPVADRYPDLWNHEENHRTISYEEFETAGDHANATVTYDIAGADAYLMDHHINGRSLFPATGHLATAWKVLGMDESVRFTSFEILQAVIFDQESEPLVEFVVITTENKLSIEYKGQCVARMCFIRGVCFASPPPTTPCLNDIDGATPIGGESPPHDPPTPSAIGSAIGLKPNDIYNEFARYGYEYETEFRLLKSRTVEDSSVGTLKPTEHIIAYLDCVLQMFLEDIDALSLPTLVRTVDLSPEIFNTIKAESTVTANTQAKTVTGTGICFSELHTTLAAPPTRFPLRHNVQRFIPWGDAEPVANMANVVAEIVGMECLGQFIDVGECVSVAVDDADPDTLEPMMTPLLNNMNDLVQSWETVGDDKTYNLVFGDTVAASKHVKDGGFLCVCDVVVESSEFVELCHGELNGAPTTMYHRVVGTASPPTTTYDWNVVHKHLEDKSSESLLYCGMGSHGFLKSIIKETSDSTVRVVDGLGKDRMSAPDVDMLQRYGLRFNTIEVVNGKKQCGTRVHVNESTEVGFRRDTVPAVQLHIDKPGDLDTLMWKEMRPTDTRVSFASLNFKDIMYSFGKLRLKKPSFGLEFSGVQGGRRVMGITATSSIATHVEPAITWDVPDEMGLDEAATIPVVYATSLYALFEKARLERGQTVLIHAGTGGIGHAAINICQKRGIEVFTTCSDGKRQYLKDTFGVDDDHLFNSRNREFRDKVLKATNGRGVDCVLNSLDGALMEASLECVAEFGNFCEIGKYDLLNNSKIGIKAFERNISYHGIDLADMFIEPRRAARLRSLLTDAIEEGVVKPLPFKTFSAEDHEKALRFMSAGKHKGKVLVEMEGFAAPVKTTKAQFFTGGTHILSGGMGGFGMELARWLVGCGAEKVVLTSRRGITEGRQQWKLRQLNAQHPGAVAEISMLDVCDESQCKQLIDAHSASLKGVWHLATVLEDTVFANMTAEKWNALFRIKETAMRNLDLLTRDMPLDAFVGFSSISSMIGNVGQSNYSSANCALEQIILDRNRAGIKGLAVQWGAIDNVGVMMKDEAALKNGFTNSICEFQNIDHSIDSFHRLLSENGVISSYEEKRLTDEMDEGEMSVERIQSQFAKILGGDASQYETAIPLSSFGLDSLSTVELVNWVNRFVRLKVNAAFLSDPNMNIGALFAYIEANGC